MGPGGGVVAGVAYPLPLRYAGLLYRRVNMTEQWKSLDCFEGFNNYEVSNRGRLRSTMCSVGRGGLVPRSTPRLCKLQASSSGYLRYRLQRFGRIRSVAIHELVLHAFVGPRPEGMWAAHGNGDKSDNRVENLRWATHPVSYTHLTLPTTSRV